MPAASFQYDFPQCDISTILTGNHTGHTSYIHLYVTTTDRSQANLEREMSDFVWSTHFGCGHERSRSMSSFSVSLSPLSLSLSLSLSIYIYIYIYIYIRHKVTETVSVTATTAPNCNELNSVLLWNNTGSVKIKCPYCPWQYDEHKLFTALRRPIKAVWHSSVRFALNLTVFKSKDCML